MVTAPEQGAGFMQAMVAGHERVAPDVTRLRLEPETILEWRPGQALNVREPGGAVRSYSISSIAAEDYFLELHVQEDAARPGQPWLLQPDRGGQHDRDPGAGGDCSWRDEWRDLDLLLIGTGTGVPPLLGMARDALRSGHRGRIHLCAGARTRAGLIDHERIAALAAEHPQLHHVAALSGETPAPGITGGRILAPAMTCIDDPQRLVVVLCGNPDMVHDGRLEAVLTGVPRHRIIADAFEPAHPQPPRDSAILEQIEPDPELWTGLGEERGLRTILENFYALAFDDERLAPFFHGVTRQRAIDKQFAFLRDAFSGSSGYLGLKPFNAHHWMIISDDLFDYRENLMESCLVRQGLAEPLVRRWNAFTSASVGTSVSLAAADSIWAESSSRGRASVSRPVDIGSVCDGCEGEMAPGEEGRMHLRTGKLYCSDCGVVVPDEERIAG
ncbi:MAG: hypothetical protein U5R48_16250 [Gammaproteobacteria bacterium]|nr:hypothetical protein [Gammaproteobacteria bacterium]